MRAAPYRASPRRHDVMGKIRESGVDDPARVEAAYMESDGAQRDQAGRLTPGFPPVKEATPSPSHQGGKGEWLYVACE